MLENYFYNTLTYLPLLELLKQQIGSTGNDVDMPRSLAKSVTVE